MASMIRLGVWVSPLFCGFSFTAKNGVFAIIHKLFAAV